MTHRLVFTLLFVILIAIERLLPEDQRPAFREQNLKLLEKEKYRLTTNGSRQYCTVDHGGAPAVPATV